MIYCSFCGKHDREVGKLVVGPSVNICDECVLSSVGIIARKYPAYRYHVIGELDKARDEELKKAVAVAVHGEGDQGRRG